MFKLAVSSFFLLTLQTSTSYAELNTLVRLHAQPLTSLIARLDSIKNSSSHIDIESFYLENDSVGNLILNKLAEQKEKNPNLQIHIVTDAWGSATMPKANICFWKSKGILWKEYNPQTPFSSFFSQGRTHRKIWIADNQFIIGGRNLAEENFDSTKLDWDLEGRGPFSAVIEKSFLEMWHLAKEIPCQEISTVPTINSSNLSQLWLLKNPEMPSWRVAKLSWTSEPVNKGFEVHKTVLKYLGSTKKSLFGENAFFIPSQDIFATLKNLARSNLILKFIFNGPGMHEPLLGQVTQCLSIPFQQQLLVKNTQIFRPQNQSVHGKSFLIDDTVLGIGSFNWDYRSAFWNAETLLIAEDAPDLINDYKVAWVARSKSMKVLTQPTESMDGGDLTPQQTQRCQAIGSVSPFAKWFF